MARPYELPIPWTPRSAPQRVTPARPAAPLQEPARREEHLPAAPLPMPALPARSLPSTDAPTPSIPVPSIPVPAVPVPAVPVPMPPAPAPDDRQVSCAGRPGGLSAAVAVGHGIALQRQETLRALLDVDAADLGALVADGTVLEVRLGAGWRYVLADAVPAAVRAAVLVSATPSGAVAA